MPATRQAFAKGVMDAYRTYGAVETATLSKSVRAAVAQGATPGFAMGHPAFTDLALGESAHCDAAVVFLDLKDFTARTFWDSPASVVRLARAVLNQLVEVVQELGGHALGLRGDGLFACFGGPASASPATDAAVALTACAYALDATQNALNQLLKMSGLEPVQLRAGADYGRLDFVRMGIEGASEVNIIGFAANFAAKCEKTALSWEIVAGDGLASLMPSSDIFTRHAESPKPYQHDYVVKNYPFYDVRWTSLLAHVPGLRDDLAGMPTSSIRIQ